MKIFKFLAMLTVSVLFFTGCDDDEITNYAFQDISAPTDVKAAFDITQDDTGTVTITPTGEGASLFQIYFGDVENETPVEVSAGESVTHIYDEGEYEVRIIAIGSTGLTSEFNQVLTISFRKPENLQITIDQPDSNPSTITVSATADFATLFDVYFGDVEDEEPVQIMPGESVEHTYEPGVYEVTVVARGAGAATTEEDAIVIVPDATDPLKLPITFDQGTVNYAAGTFNGTSYEIVVNPDPSGSNPEESNVAAVTNSGNNWEGIFYTMGEPVDFSGNSKTITMNVWSDVAIPVLLKFEGGVNDERQTEVSANHGGTGWEELTFDFSTDAIKSYIDGTQGAGEPFVPTGQYGTMVIFIDGPGNAAGTFYLDDIEQSSGAPFKLPVTFDNLGSYTSEMVAPFGGSFEVVANPDPSGDNPTVTNVGAFTKGGGLYEGLTFNLDEAIDFSTDNKTMSLTLWSDQEFTVLFKLETGVNGERSNEVRATHTGSGWETLTFDFYNATKSYIDGTQGVGEAFVPVGQYASFSVFFAFEANIAGTFYIDDIIRLDDAGSGGGDGGGSGSTATSFPVDFETAATGGQAANWSVFENVDNPPLEIISNPDMTGNTSATVAKFTARQDGNPWAGTITQLQNPITLNSSNAVVKIWVWKSVISDVGIKFENATQGSTGEIKVANTKTNEWEELTFDFSAVIGDVNNTNITGLVVFPDFQDRSQENVIYFDNITLNSTSEAGSGGGSAAAPSAAAPSPTIDAANVLSIYSDAYTDPSGINYFPNWGQSTTLEVVDFSGNEALKYSNANYQGIEFGESLDASGYTTVHIDIWSGDYTSIPFYLISPGPNERFVTLNVTPNQWTSIEIPLSDFTSQGLDVSDLFQIKFDVQPEVGGTFYVDNIYFHN